MKIHLLLTAIFLFTSVAYSDTSDCEKSSSQIHFKLRDDLLCDYDSYIRPKIEHTNTTNVIVRLVVKNFIYDTHNHMLTVNTWAVINWEDDHLKWDPSQYQSIDEIHIGAAWIWTPDLSIYNSFDQNSETKVIGSDVDCMISNTGTVICIVPAKFETLCTADLTNYPYDIQTCQLFFGSWVHAGEEMNITLNDLPVALDEFEPNPEWKLLNVSYKRSKGEYDCCPNSTYPMVIFTFKIQRRSSFHEATIIAPCLGLLIMCLSAQFMDVREIERFALSICNILCHTIYMQYISWQVPSVGDSVPRIILFGRDSLIIVFIQLIVLIILRNLTKSQGDRPSWISDVISRALDSRVGHSVLVLDFSMKGIGSSKGDDDGANIIDNVERNTQKDCLLFAKLADRLFFVIFFITYAMMFFALIL